MIVVARRLLLALSLLLAVAMPARADILMLKAAGLVTGGIDESGLFGAAGRDLTGQRYTVDFAIDTALIAPADPFALPYAYGNLVFPAGTYAGASPIAATLRIDGGAFTFAPAGSGVYLATSAPLEDFAFDDPAVDFFLVIGTDKVPGTAAALGLVRFMGQSRNGFTYETADATTQLTFGAVATAAVPEPTGWAVMVVGFGLVGGTLRRRRPATQPA